jgi:hypothetical protein
VPTLWATCGSGAPDPTWRAIPAPHNAAAGWDALSIWVRRTGSTGHPNSILTLVEPDSPVIGVPDAGLAQLPLPTDGTGRGLSSPSPGDPRRFLQLARRSGSGPYWLLASEGPNLAADSGLPQRPPGSRLPRYGRRLSPAILSTTPLRPLRPATLGGSSSGHAYQGKPGARRNARVHHNLRTARPRPWLSWVRRAALALASLLGGLPARAESQLQELVQLRYR